MRIAIALLAALLLSVCAAACGSNGSSDASKRSAAATVATPASGTATPAASGTATPVAGGTAAPAAGGTSPMPRAVLDSDEDDQEHLPSDDENSSVRDFGHPASPSDANAVTAFVKRYFAAALAGDGTRGCSMVVAGLVRAAPEDYGQYGPPYLRGAKTCAAVLSRLFAHEHHLLASRAAHLTVLDVRLQGNGGLVLLGFGKGQPERQFSVGREGAQWKASTLFDGELP